MKKLMILAALAAMVVTGNAATVAFRIDQNGAITQGEGGENYNGTLHILLASNKNKGNAMKDAVDAAWKEGDSNIDLAAICVAQGGEYYTVNVVNGIADNSALTKSSNMGRYYVLAPMVINNMPYLAEGIDALTGGGAPTIPLNGATFSKTLLEGGPGAHILPVPEPTSGLLLLLGVAGLALKRKRA